MNNENKTHILLTGKPFEAKVKGRIREVAAAIAVSNFSFGIGILYQNDEGKLTGSTWGLMLPVLIARSYRAMRILECIKDFDVESGLLCYTWSAACISEVHATDLENVEKIRSLIGESKLQAARSQTMSADEIDTLLINLHKAHQTADTDHFMCVYNNIDFSNESAGLWPTTDVVRAYSKGSLSINEQAPLPRFLHDNDPLRFDEVMKFNNILWPLFRQKFTNRNFTLNEALDFLGVKREEYLAMEG